MVHMNTMKALDLVGETFGRLRVLRRHDSGDGRRLIYWGCECVCGQRVRVTTGSLRSGNTKSCGCLQREKAASNCSSKATHGEARHGRQTPEYRAWAQMLTRCENPDDRQYADYGGRGITVCARWHVYENFLADMGRRTSPQHSIDRKDNDGGYEPGNCRWATREEQCRNRRSGKIVCLRGEVKTLVEWCEIFGLDYNAAYSRLRAGWPVDKVFSTPVGRARN